MLDADDLQLVVSSIEDMILAPCMSEMDAAPRLSYTSAETSVEGSSHLWSDSR